MGKEIYKKYLKQKKRYLVFLIFIIGVGVAISSLSPYVFGEIIDIISGQGKKEFKIWILFYAALLLMAQLFSILESLVGQWVVTSVENSMKSQLMNRIVRMKSQRAEEFAKGELLNRLEFDVEIVGDYYIDFVSSILMIGVNLVISIYFIFRISSRLSFVAILFFPLMYGINLVFQWKVRSLEREQKKINDKYYSFINSIFVFLNPIKSFGIQEYMGNEFNSFLAKRLHIEMKNVMTVSGISMIRSILGSVLNVMLLTMAGIFITRGEMTVGNLVTFNSYLDMLFQAVKKILELNLNRQGVLVSYERLKDLEKEKLETEQDGLEKLDAKIFKVQMKDVHFSYKPGKTVLNSLAFDISTPGLYSFAGENGSGKTTILKLLERFYKPDMGTILVNDKRIEEYRLGSLRDEIAYMEKEPFFIHGTVYINLRLGNEKADEEKIEEVCRLVGIHRDIMNMNQQYRTIIEEGGRNLSSGQKQKLGLARVFLKENTSLYLLDEVTSDLDGEAEKNIADILEKVAETAIVINVSHKKELLKRSKDIFVIEDGHIADKGTHAELLKKSKLYQKLYGLEDNILKSK